MLYEVITGKIRTERVPLPGGGKVIIDGGPESFVTRKPEVWELAQELGLQDLLLDPGSETRNIFVLDRGKPIAIPLTPVSFLLSPLMSMSGKVV